MPSKALCSAYWCVGRCLRVSNGIYLLFRLKGERMDVKIFLPPPSNLCVRIGETERTNVITAIMVTFHISVRELPGLMILNCKNKASGSSKWGFVRNLSCSLYQAHLLLDPCHPPPAGSEKNLHQAWCTAPLTSYCATRFLLGLDNKIYIQRPDNTGGWRGLTSEICRSTFSTKVITPGQTN